MTMINWKEDITNNTLEGWLNGVLYFDIEKTESDGVILYQMKKPLGNYIEFTSLEEAKKYCEKIAETEIKC